MAHDGKKGAGKKPQSHGGAEAPAAVHCKFDGCKQMSQKFGFCMEHYEWYMAGVIRGDGRKPVDFDQKYRLFQEQHRNKKVA